uniref:Uncharacterized protein n=1 Tax=Arundo donax TaxID=35708 RepID=A0A0A8ZSQ3_ARUDO
MDIRKIELYPRIVGVYRPCTLDFQIKMWN